MSDEVGRRNVGAESGSSNVLFALALPELLELARAFANSGFVPMLAFGGEQIVEFSSNSELVFADEVIDPGAQMLRRAGTDHAVIRLFIAEAYRNVPPEIHAVIPPGLPPDEVLARARTLLALRGERVAPAELEWGPLRLDLARRNATWHGASLLLTQTQIDILAALVRANGAVVSKVDLQKAVWPDEPPDSGERLVAHVRRIRQRIEVNPSHPRFLVTSRGLGFRLAACDGSNVGVEAVASAPTGVARA